MKISKEEVEKTIIHLQKIELTPDETKSIEAFYELFLPTFPNSLPVPNMPLSRELPFRFLSVPSRAAQDLNGEIQHYAGFVDCYLMAHPLFEAKVDIFDRLMAVDIRLQLFDPRDAIAFIFEFYCVPLFNHPIIQVRMAAFFL